MNLFSGPASAGFVVAIAKFIVLRVLLTNDISPPAVCTVPLRPTNTSCVSIGNSVNTALASSLFDSMTAELCVCDESVCALSRSVALVTATSEWKVTMRDLSESAMAQRGGCEGTEHGILLPDT